MQNPGKQIIKLTGSDFTYPVQIDYANASTETTIKLESAGKIQAYAIKFHVSASLDFLKYLFTNICLFRYSYYDYDVCY